MWTLALSLLALVAAIPSGPSAVLTVDTAFPAVGQLAHFNASGSMGHDAGMGKIVAYNFSFGDGYATGNQASPFAEHAYAAEGTFVAVVIVVDGRASQASASLTMHPGSSPPPPVQLPDLVPIQARLTPANPTVNDSVNVTIVVLNRGGGAANTATIAAYDVPENATPAAAGQQNLSQTLGPSQSVTLVVGPFVVSVAGNHLLRILVTNVSPAEVSSTGHELDLRFTVASVKPGPGGGGVPAFVVSPLALGLGAIAVAAGVGAAYLFLRPKPPGPLEPPPASPPDRSPPPIWPP